MVKAFVTYRRDDSAEIAHQIYDQLLLALGSDCVFLDVDTIKPALDFRAQIVAAMEQSDVTIALIGRKWLGEDPVTRMRRIDDPDDYVRVEVELALKLNIPLLPLLVHGADMPHAEVLPEPLRPLTFQQALRVRSRATVVDDISRLITALTARVSLPGPDFVPESLRRLGFVGQRIKGTDVILPPVCRIPAGTFVMGSDPQHDPQAAGHESPQHQYYLFDYFIAKYPVTVAEYRCAVRVGAVQEPPERIDISWREQEKHLSGYGKRSRRPWGSDESWWGQEEHADCPVVCISWNDALAYTAWLSQLTGAKWRLPSEAEWEKAARGTDGRIYPWGNVWDPSRVNTAEAGIHALTPVGSHGERGASPYGAQDMAGNVHEWCNSLYKPYPYRSDTGGEDDTITGFRVLRGASWRDGQPYARVAFRYSDRQTDVHRGHGFRLAHDIED